MPYITYKNIEDEPVIREEQIRNEIATGEEIDWNKVSRYGILSEDFIREYQDKVYWTYISEYQVLSESFMHEFKDRLSWWFISTYQILTEEFINNHLEYVCIDDILVYNYKTHEGLSDDFKLLLRLKNL
jgi:hypothetical protein